MRALTDLEALVLERVADGRGPYSAAPRRQARVVTGALRRLSARGLAKSSDEYVGEWEVTIAGKAEADRIMGRRNAGKETT